MSQPEKSSRDTADRRSDETFTRASEALDRGDKPTAFRLFLKGAEEGDRYCEFNVASCYYGAAGTKKSFAEALRWYWRAYRHGLPYAATSIGLVLRDNGSRRRSLAWFHRGLRGGDDCAALELAKEYVAKRRQLTTAVRYLRRVTRSWKVSVADREEAEGLLETLGRGSRAQRR